MSALIVAKLIPDLDVPFALLTLGPKDYSRIFLFLSMPLLSLLTSPSILIIPSYIIC